jgi:hypothetical protein
MHEPMNVTFKQLQKYEGCKNTISASSLLIGAQGMLPRSRA